MHQINLTIKPGEWVFLVGANGSGKSTLARLLAGYGSWRATGSIRARHHAYESSKAVSFTPLVMQNPEASLVGMTPGEDAMLLLEQLGVPAEEIAPRVQAALRRTGIEAHQASPIARLSGGQKQLTAIAGCIASGADALLLDEPTSMLDPDASDTVLKAVRALHHSGTTVIWVTQRLEEIGPGDRIVSLKDGRITYDGSAEQFFIRPSVNMPSACEQAGIEAPYIVETVWALQAEGIVLQPSMPLTASELAKAVKSYGQ
ncbi:energy-coupling factor ABC transporter ATP-binding protein [Paenibacillus xylaniclasticus]|uniref:energy-coupling factor ABC transporter ATP-binding protein n=1 Tax=Paenibacillus xylaniclasticus TaxID=588083 RepID=UPI0013DEE5CB|nr:MULTISPECIES: ATP-binding cassette domain-containing protein [Paenibacillus]GFN31808.1 energy-coupling factor transporter ATP-binding protein EcfA1 [Paenibacillus curdlanolyticus]